MMPPSPSQAYLLFKIALQGLGMRSNSGSLQTIGRLVLLIRVVLSLQLGNLDQLEPIFVPYFKLYWNVDRFTEHYQPL